MLKIRLSRRGKKHQSSYRIIITEASRKRDGAYLDLVGHYNPNTDPPTIKIDKKLYLEWLKKGAQPTETVANLARKTIGSL